MAKENKQQLPVEVSLINEVKSCRQCQWFWGGIPPYGPFPAIDWDEKYPEAMRKKISQSEKFTKWTSTKITGSKLIEPAVLRGCRKAPIMTIGINPNLTAYFATEEGARRTYPIMADNARYAYYYRHATVFQESIDISIIRKNIQEGTEILGEGEGWFLGSRRGSDFRWMNLMVKYKGSDEIVNYEMAWDTDLSGVVLLESIDIKDIEKISPNIQKGTVIAGKINSFEAMNQVVYQNGVDYYQRLLPALDIFKNTAGGEMKDISLNMGEDISMHDMVACASPGWSDAYDIPRDVIADNCIRKKQFVFRELFESKPKLIILVSTSSMHMFAQEFISIGGDIDLEYENRDVYDLLKETCLRSYFINYNKDNINFKARIIVTPHFSYSENFRNQSRFSVLAWQAFENEFPNDAEVLKNENRIMKQTWSAIIPLDIKGIDDSIKDKMGCAAWEIIMARFYNPAELIANALIREHRNGTLVLDAKTKHLKRSEGDCSFCSNSEWSFPEGCQYGKC